jgi:hypothetical protein
MKEDVLRSWYRPSPTLDNDLDLEQIGHEYSKASKVFEVILSV